MNESNKRTSRNATVSERVNERMKDEAKTALLSSFILTHLTTRSLTVAFLTFHRFPNTRIKIRMMRSSERTKKKIFQKL
jgi:hypothetical protein